MCFLDGNEISARFYGRHLRIRDRASTRARGFHPPGNIHPRAGLLHTTLPLPPFLPLPRDNLVTGDTYPLNPQEACLRARHLIVHRTGPAIHLYRLGRNLFRTFLFTSTFRQNHPKRRGAGADEKRAERNSSSSLELHGFLTNGSDPIGYVIDPFRARDKTSCVTVEGERSSIVARDVFLLDFIVTNYETRHRKGERRR